jgi:hypothetical protein
MRFLKCNNARSPCQFAAKILYFIFIFTADGADNRGLLVKFAVIPNVAGLAEAGAGVNDPGYNTSAARSFGKINPTSS